MAKKSGRARKPRGAAKKVSFITVRVGRLPGVINDIALNGGRTVKDALEGAELDDAGHEIRVNGSLAKLETDLRQGDTVLLVRKIKGN
jgi:sulfur carrier protein ThiS